MIFALIGLLFLIIATMVSCNQAVGKIWMSTGDGIVRVFSASIPILLTMRAFVIGKELAQLLCNTDGTANSTIPLNTEYYYFFLGISIGMTGLASFLGMQCLHEVSFLCESFIELKFPSHLISTIFVLLCARIVPLDCIA